MVNIIPKSLVYYAGKHNSAPFRNILRLGFDTERRDSHGETLLHRFIKRDKIEAIKKMIENKANLEATDRYGNTALQAAIKHGQYDLRRKKSTAVRILLEAGANPNALSARGTPGPGKLCTLSVS